MILFPDSPTTINGNNVELAAIRFASFCSRFNESFIVELIEDVVSRLFVLFRFNGPLNNFKFL